MTATAEKMKSLVDELPEGSMRRRVIDTARRFKSSWIELGRMLSEVKRAELWREWGFASFDAYCGKELFIRKSTAEKLTMSYGFMERHEPALVRERDVEDDASGAGEGPRPAPAFEVIEVLSRAEAAGRLPEDGWRELRDDILERPPTPTALNRQLTERYGAAPRPEPRRGGSEGVQRLVGMAKRLASACAGDDRVPASVTERARALVEDLEDLA